MEKAELLERAIKEKELAAKPNADYDMDASRKSSASEVSLGQDLGVSKAGLAVATNLLKEGGGATGEGSQAGFEHGMSPSALLGAMEGLFKSTDGKAEEGEAGRSLALAAVAKSPDVIKELKRSLKLPETFRRIEPISQPFFGAWMGTVRPPAAHPRAPRACIHVQPLTCTARAWHVHRWRASRRCRCRS